MRIRRLLVALVGAAIAGAGCAGGDPRGGVPGDVTTALALRAEGVAAALEAGRCDSALTEARALQTDLAAADLAPEVRAEALAGAARLVNGIVCPPPPPPTTTTSATVAPPVDQDAPRGKRDKDRKDDNDDD